MSQRVDAMCKTSLYSLMTTNVKAFASYKLRLVVILKFDVSSFICELFDKMVIQLNCQANAMVHAAAAK